MLGSITGCSPMTPIPLSEGTILHCLSSVQIYKKNKQNQITTKQNDDNIKLQKKGHAQVKT